jgi:hypothetical protein
METNINGHEPAMRSPTELDLFKAEIFAQSSDDDDNEELPCSVSPSSTVHELASPFKLDPGVVSPHSLDDDDDRSIDVAPSPVIVADGEHQHRRPFNVGVASPLPEFDGDEVTVRCSIDDDDSSDRSSSCCSSTAIGSRRVSNTSGCDGGDTTPQLDVVHLASALSLVRTVVPPMTATPSSAAQSEHSRYLTTPKIKRVDVKSSGVKEPHDDGTSFGNGSGDKNDGNMAIRSSLWQPMKPGYTPNIAMMGGQDGIGPGSAVLIHRTVAVERNVVTTEQESSFRLVIPIMTRHTAAICAVLNVLSPGLGQRECHTLFQRFLLGDDGRGNCALSLGLMVESTAHLPRDAIIDRQTVHVILGAMMPRSVD